MKDDQLSLLALDSTGVFGPASYRKMISGLGGFGKVLSVPTTDLQKIGLTAKQIEAVNNAKKIDPKTIDAKLKHAGAGVLILGDKNYPHQLAELPDPPYVVYLKGSIEPQDRISVAIVGSRRTTQYGRQVTEDFARAASQSGLTIISGLALGVDAIAHAQAIENGSRTIAVLGCGIDQVYPSSNYSLAKKIIDRKLGAIVSEYSPGTPSFPSNFPVRNRIIAGLAETILVTEAAIDSGSIHTAKAAMEYGRDVYVIPHPIYSETGKGVNMLLTQGAIPVVDTKEWLEMIQAPKREVVDKKIILEDKEKQIFDLLTKEPIHADAIARKVNQSISEVVGILATLELKGLVRHTGGMRYTN